MRTHAFPFGLRMQETFREDPVQINGCKWRSYCLVGGMKVLLLALLTEVSLPAQNLYGAMTGSVRDPVGGLIVGAKVVVTSVTENSSRQTVSNQAGEYNVPNLLPGQYIIQVAMAGFQAFRANGVSVSLGATTRVDAQLTLGVSSEEIVVQADVNALQTEQADVRDQISQKAIEDLPTPIGRNY
jgi:hypothetical protein